MENAGPFLMMIGFCCVWPGLAFVAGMGYARGWFRSPINTQAMREERHPGEEGF